MRPDELAENAASLRLKQKRIEASGVEVALGETRGAEGKLASLCGLLSGPVYILVFCTDPLMVVLLDRARIPFREALGLGRQCGLVYGLLWESAAMDVRLHERHPYNRNLACGGCTEWSVKGIARECHLGKASVHEALKDLLDAGFIQYAGWVPARGSPKRRWRVTHPKHLEDVRHAISVMGLPSLKYTDDSNDKAQASEGETWQADLDGNVWLANSRERADYEMERDAELSLRYGEGEGCGDVEPAEV